MYLIILRLLHILCGVLWAGTAIYNAGFVFPAVSALGPEGGKFMQQIAKTNKFPIVINAAAGLNILSGILLIERLSNHFTGAWFSTTYGMGITTGGVFALIAFFIGTFVSRPTVMKIGKLGAEIQAAGGPPSPEQMKEMTRLRGVITMATNYMAIILVIAVSLMAVSRYL